MVALLSNLMAKLKKPWVAQAVLLGLGSMLVHGVDHSWMWAVICSALLIGGSWLVNKMFPVPLK